MFSFPPLLSVLSLSLPLLAQMEGTSSKGDIDAAHPSPRLERKTVEKNRRVLMKSLFTRLDALLPHTKQGATGHPERLGDAACYIRNLQERLAKLRERRDSLVSASSSAGSRPAAGSGGTSGSPARLPHVEVQDHGPALEVVVVSSRRDRLVFYEVVRALEEGGAEVVNAGFSVVDDRAFHGVHSLVPESRLGREATLSMAERLKKIVHDFAAAA